LVEIVNELSEDTEVPKKRKRRTKAEIEADKVTAKIEDAQKRVRQYTAKKKTEKEGLKVEPVEMYTLKFNSPILPYASFPLT
jgi:hypothetical protein